MRVHAAANFWFVHCRPSSGNGPANFHIAHFRYAGQSDTPKTKAQVWAEASEVDVEEMVTVGLQASQQFQVQSRT